MKLARFKLPVWALPLLIAGLVAALGWWGIGLVRATIEDQLRMELSATLSANVTALNIWSGNQTRLATALAEDPNVRDPAVAVLDATPLLRRDFRPLPELQQFITELRPRMVPLGYSTAQLVNTNFMIVANSVRPQFMVNNQVSDSHTNKYAQLFLTGQPVIITPFRPEFLVQRRLARTITDDSLTNMFLRRLNRSAQTMANHRRGDLTLMQVAAPVRDRLDHIVGALALIIDPQREFSRILSVARSGETGETYAFDQSGLLISESRFDEQLREIGLLDGTNITSALNLRLRDPGGDLTKGYIPDENEQYPRPLTRLVASAVDAEDEVDVRPWRDYRGVPVVGASRWLPQFGFGVATQIDADEAFRPLRVLQLVFVILILFLMLCATGMFVYSYANRAWQQRLSEAELKLKQLGQYTLEEKIGEGGMGVVYRARHALLRRETAVKLLVPQLAGTAAVQRFEREVCLTCQLTHHNTIQVYDYGHTPEGIFYYAMEFLNGVNLHDLVARFGPQPEGRVVHIMAQICDSLAEAHALGLIHRDVKPGNVFVCRRGGVADLVKVLDFGLVRDFRNGGPDEVTPDGQRAVEGTPWFMPPEAIEGSAPADPRSDIYSLGALGYFLLTGHYIFNAETIAEIHQKQLATPPIPPTARTANRISEEMERLLLRCLAKDMAARPQSAAELRAALLATPAASAWTPEDSAAWWDAYDRLPPPGVSGSKPIGAETVPTVNVDLSSRME